MPRGSSCLNDLGRLARSLSIFVTCATWFAVLSGCAADGRHAQQVIHTNHAPRVQAIIRDDLERGLRGVTSAATRMERGFRVERTPELAGEMRRVLQQLREPPRGVPELMISPMSFVAAVDSTGHVIARDSDPDPMAGFDAGEAFPHVRRALTEGVASYALSEFPSLDPEEPPSVTIIFVAPVRDAQGISGAIMAGTPLWREAQRLTRQLQAESAHEPGTILWVYFYRGDALHHHGTPADLDTIVPDGTARGLGLTRSPGGFTGEVMQFGRSYSYGVLPLPRIANDTGVVIFRSDPV